MSSISVVMPVYNGQRFLRKQVVSVLSELQPGDELIVVNDASSDGSLAILKNINSSLLKIYTNTCNVGVNGSLERGLRLAVNEIIFLCDQDDLWLPGKRDAFVAAFNQDSTVMVVVSDAQLIDDQGFVTAPSFMSLRGGFGGSVFSTVWRNCYLGCAMAIRDSLLKVALPVPQLVPRHDMWFGAIGWTIGNVIYLPAPFLQYRRHTDNVSPLGGQSLLRMFCWRMALVTALWTRILLYRLGLKR